MKDAPRSTKASPEETGNEKANQDGTPLKRGTDLFHRVDTCYKPHVREQCDLLARLF